MQAETALGSRPKVTGGPGQHPTVTGGQRRRKGGGGATWGKGSGGGLGCELKKWPGHYVVVAQGGSRHGGTTI
jgi:hypothetical protein